MAASFDSTNARELTPQKRLDALAALLAIGAGRALALRALPPWTPAKLPQDSSKNQLDVSPEMGLHVPRG